jgi:peptidyl-prolyl cis-trans isomerase B (cyclophilin B)
VLIITEYGNITIELYNVTPKHRDNFIKLIQDSVYTNLLFHRTIKSFMIQGGDPDSRKAQPGQLLGEGGLPYTVPAEFNKKLYHKRGVLAAAREGDSTNPKKESSSTQFYIVVGKKFNEKDLVALENKRNQPLLKKKLEEMHAVTKSDTIKAKKLLEKTMFKIPKKHRTTYIKTGGTPHLDQNYTVFGEVTEGMEVVDKIVNLQTDKNDRPIADIRFTIKMKN